jgi:hypothetical protein
VSVHHATLLANLRKEVSTDPMGVLRAFQKYKDSLTSGKKKSKSKTSSSKYDDGENVNYSEIGTESEGPSNSTNKSTIQTGDRASKFMVQDK